MQVIVSKSGHRSASLRSRELASSRLSAERLQHHQPEFCISALGECGQGVWRHLKRDKHGAVTLNVGSVADGAVTEVMPVSVPLGYCSGRLRTTGWTGVAVLREAHRE